MDESLEIGMNQESSPNYNSNYNTFYQAFETNYKDTGLAYDEWYLQWKRAATGKYYRNFMTAFNEVENNGIVPWIETHFIGNITFRPTCDLSTYSNTYPTLSIKENRQVQVGALDGQLSQFDITSEDATYPALSIRSGSQRPGIGFSTYSSGTGLSPMYSELRMQNISAVANHETGRFLFNLRNDGTLATKFTMHENGLFGVNKTPTRALHILDAKFTAGQRSTSILVEADGMGGMNGDATVIGFRGINGKTDILGLGLGVNSGYNFFIDYFGNKKFQIKLETGEVQIYKSISFTNAKAVDGSEVDNGNMFKGVDGALYYKGGSGTVTKIANT